MCACGDGMNGDELNGARRPTWTPVVADEAFWEKIEIGKRKKCTKKLHLYLNYCILF
jgi:hypothetical protein